MLGLPIEYYNIDRKLIPMSQYQKRITQLLIQSLELSYKNLSLRVLVKNLTITWGKPAVPTQAYSLHNNVLHYQLYK